MIITMSGMYLSHPSGGLKGTMSLWVWSNSDISFSGVGPLSLLANSDHKYKSGKSPLASFFSFQYFFLYLLIMTAEGATTAIATLLDEGNRAFSKEDYESSTVKFGQACQQL